MQLMIAKRNYLSVSRAIASKCESIPKIMDRKGEAVHTGSESALCQGFVISGEFFDELFFGGLPKIA